MKGPPSLLATVLATASLAFAVVAVACGTDASSPAGSPAADGGASVVSDDFVQSKVVEPLEAECGSCHSSARAEKGLILSGLTPERLRERVVDVRAIQADSLVLVSPGNPAKSYLYLKIKGDLTNVACLTGCGSKMPLGKDYGAERLADLEKWIAEGAK